MANALLVHPDTLDFWQIGAYAELELKGNLFSSRNLMLQALRANEESTEFQLAYLAFEVRFLEKLMHRREILTGKKSLDQDGKLVESKDAELAFIDEEDQDGSANPEGEIKQGEEANIVKIVVANLISKYSQNAKVLKEAKRICKRSPQVPEETVQSLATAYSTLKQANFAQVLEQLYPANCKGPSLEALSKSLTKIRAIDAGEQKIKALNFLVDKATKLYKSIALDAGENSADDKAGAF